jgi:hypothetical protein
MWMSRHHCFQIVLLGLGLSACRGGVAGRYELDVEETKVCVAKAAVDNPEEASMKNATIELMAKTRLDMHLEEGGKMTSTMVVTGPEAFQPRTHDGSWKMDGKRVVIQVKGVDDTVCEVEGKRLRCKKPSPGTLYSNYVLVKK